MANFLAEAAALAARAPHVLYEQQQGILLNGPVAGGNSEAGAAGMSVPEASLLAVAALRQARKVASSAKMPLDVRAAVCGYVAGMENRLACSRSRMCRTSHAGSPGTILPQVRSNPLCMQAVRSWQAMHVMASQACPAGNFATLSDRIKLYACRRAVWAAAAAVRPCSAGTADPWPSAACSSTAEP